MIRHLAWLSFALAGMILAAPMASQADGAIASGGCEPLEAGLNEMLTIAGAVHGKFADVALPDMKSFAASLGEDGKSVTGDAAFLLMMPQGKTIVFVQRGDRLCLAKVLDKFSAPPREERGA